MKPHSCPVCGKGFRTPEALANHERDMHGAKRVYGPFDCTICGKRTGSSINLARHMEAHGQGQVETPKFPVGRRPTLAEIDPTCLECGGQGRLVSGKEIYPHRRDLYEKRFYLCACGAYCGCHPNSVVPLGHPCGPETRRARHAAHAAFDPIWRSGRMTRASAYKWLAGELGIDPSVCHIGMMTADRAWRVVEVIRAAEHEAA
ncbi:zinc-finger-containing protein [Novosphingobium sp.]|uniref:zinc-finger-containing protein n=1 Tax=Novosphingobium sp. TaxID=1874826 RepID=UPI00352B59AB